MDLGNPCSQASGERGVQRLPFADAVQVVRQIEDRTQGNQPLGFEDPDQVLHHLLMRVRGSFGNPAGQQVQHAVLHRNALGRLAGLEQISNSGAARVENVLVTADFRERLQKFRQCCVRRVARNALLAHEDLPQPDQGLRGTGGIGAQALVANRIDGASGFEIRQYRGIGQRGNFGEQRILRGKRPIVARQLVHGGRIQGLGAPPVDVGQRHENLQRLIFSGLAAQAEERFEHVVGVFPLSGGAGEFGVIFALGVIGEKPLPDFQASWKMRLAVRIQAQPGGQQQHVGIGPEYRPGRTRAGDLAMNSRIESLQTFGLRQVVLHRAFDAGERVEVTGQPPVVARDQPLKESRALIRANASVQIGPLFLAARAARNHGFPFTDLEHAAEEIEDVRIDLEPRRGERLAQLLGRPGIQFGQGHIQPAQGGIAQEVVDKLALVFVWSRIFCGRLPVIGRV